MTILTSAPHPEDVITIEARARALRAAMLRDAARGLVARLRGALRIPSVARHA